MNYWTWMALALGSWVAGSFLLVASWVALVSVAQRRRRRAWWRA